MSSLSTPRPRVNSSYQPANEFEAAGLTPREEFAYSQWRALGGNYRAIAADPQTATVYGRQPSHETVRSDANKAHAKMRGFGSLARAAQAEGTAGLLDAGRLTEARYMKADSETHARGVRGSDLDVVDHELDRLVEAYVREAQGGPLSAGRQAYYAARHTALAAQA